MFEFKHIKPFDRSYADNPGPMVSLKKLICPQHEISIGSELQQYVDLSGGVCHTRYAACWPVFANLQEMGWQ